jgi:hypothetical protein
MKKLALAELAFALVSGRRQNELLVQRNPC